MVVNRLSEDEFGPSLKGSSRNTDNPYGFNPDNYEFVGLGTYGIKVHRNKTTGAYFFGNPNHVDTRTGKEMFKDSLKDIDVALSLIEIGNLKNVKKVYTNLGRYAKNSKSKGIIKRITSLFDDFASKGTSKAVNKTRVGQWMSEAEYKQFLKSGEIPRTNVLVKGKEGYIKQANIGDYYVEFDIDSSLLVPKNQELGWSLVKSKNQMYLKLAEKKGQILPSPIGENINHIYTKTK